MESFNFCAVSELPQIFLLPGYRSLTWKIAYITTSGKFGNINKNDILFGNKKKKAWFVEIMILKIMKNFKSYLGMFRNVFSCEFCEAATGSIL